MKKITILILIVFLSFSALSAVSAGDNVTDNGVHLETLDDGISNDNILTQSNEKNLSYNQKTISNTTDSDTSLQSVDSNFTLVINSSDELLYNDSNDKLLTLYNTSVLGNGGVVSLESQDNPLYGIVNIGSNGIKLKVYELKKSGKISNVFSSSEISVIKGYTVNNTLTKDGIYELVSILKDFNKIMDLVNVDVKYVFATASLRKISNSDEVVSIVKDKLGIDIHIINGEKEANSTFKGVNENNELTEKDGVLIDLGGGSCEIIDFLNRTPVTSESMPIGSFSCYLKYVGSMFPDECEINAIQNRTLHELSKLVIKNDSQRNDLFVSGGSGKTIKKILEYLNYIDDATSFEVSMLDSLLNGFKNNTKENFLKILGVVADDINTAVPGLIIIKTIANYFNITNIHICKKGAGDGILIELIENNSGKRDVNLNSSDIDIFPDEHGEICVILPINATGEVIMQFNNISSAYSISNGTTHIILPKLDSGNYTAEIYYSGDNYYLSKSRSVNIHVKSVTSDMSDMIRGWNSSFDYQVKLMDELGKPIENKLISFAIAGNNYYTLTDSNGFAKIKVGLNVGTYKINISSSLFNQTVTKTLKIVKRITNNKNLNVVYNSNLKYNVKIIGDDGLPEIKGKSVTVMIDNKKHVYKTDKSGFITINLNKYFKPGKHTIKITYKGCTVTNHVAVKHALQSKKVVSVKKSAKKIFLNAKLISNDKQPIKNKKISFKINGKTYATFTNKNGIAKVTLKKFKAGSYSLKVVYLKEVLARTVKIY